MKLGFIKSLLLLGITILCLIGCYPKISETTDSVPTKNTSETHPVKIANPAAMYCVEIMGYEYIFITTADGSVSGICIMPDGQECNPWAFYAGECGEEYSYCVQKDLTIETRSNGEDPYSITYGVCVDDEGKEVLFISELLSSD